MHKIFTSLSAILFIIFAVVEVVGQVELVKDINTGPNSDSYPRHMTVSGDKVFFVAYDGSAYSDLWMTDGTEDGTVRLRDLKPDMIRNVAMMVDVEGVLYFTGYVSSYQELWRTDGTASGTQRVRQILPGAGSSISVMKNVNGILYFGTTSPAQLWKTDGTTNGTHSLQTSRRASANWRILTIQFSSATGISTSALSFGKRMGLGQVPLS